MTDATCYIPSCDEPRSTRGFCDDHYGRLKRHGHPLAGGPPKTLTLEQRFWAKVHKDGPIPKHRPDLGPCWIWTASATSEAGYGHFAGPDGRTVRAYRLAYEGEKGPIPEGLVMDHLCDNPRCVRPAHLDPKTSLANVLRSPRHYANRTHCKNGHPFTEANTRIMRRPDRTNTYRRCRQCERDRDKARQPRKRRGE